MLFENSGLVKIFRIELDDGDSGSYYLTNFSSSQNSNYPSLYLLIFYSQTRFNKKLYDTIDRRFLFASALTTNYWPKDSKSHKYIFYFGRDYYDFFSRSLNRIDGDLFGFYKFVQEVSK